MRLRWVEEGEAPALLAEFKLGDTQEELEKLMLFTLWLRADARTLERIVDVSTGFESDLPGDANARLQCGNPGRGFGLLHRARDVRYLTLSRRRLRALGLNRVQVMMAHGVAPPRCTTA